MRIENQPNWCSKRLPICSVKVQLAGATLHTKLPSTSSTSSTSSASSSISASSALASSSPEMQASPN